jgi:hypothetical protein
LGFLLIATKERKKEKPKRSKEIFLGFLKVFQTREKKARK